MRKLDSWIESFILTELEASLVILALCVLALIAVSRLMGAEALYRGAYEMIAAIMAVGVLILIGCAGSWRQRITKN